MSRCYPFPPPGYEKTPGSYDVDLIAKEKKKEKKHKKDKDKEKREGKEKKDKNRSKDKHKEKKERKEKAKEKKRHKEKLSDGGKNKERTHDENEEKFSDSTRKFEEAKTSKLAEELAGRCQDNGATGRIHKYLDSSNIKAEGLGTWALLEKEISHGNEMAANHISKDQNRSNGSSVDAEKKLQGGEKARERLSLVVNLVSRDNTKYDEGARTMHKELVKGTEQKHVVSEKNRMGAGKIQENQTRNNVLDQQVEKAAGMPKQKDDNNKQKRANLIVQVERTSTDAGMDIGGCEKSEDKDVDGGKSNNHRHKDRAEKKHRKKDKDKHKKGKEGQRDRHENKHKDSKTKDGQENGLVNAQILATHKESVKYVDIDENFRKRKDQEMNGLLHESELRPLKLPKSLPSSLPLHVENGRTVPLSGFANSKPGGMNCKIDGNQASNHVNHKINGTPSVGARSSVAANSSQKHEVTLEPPHPDTKYLNIIYSVPKVEQPEVDNQDWLFNRDVCRPEPKADVKIDEPTAQVWSKALRIGSPDVFALPYVIPY